jgi:hypothetical protein
MKNRTIFYKHLIAVIEITMLVAGLSGSSRADQRDYLYIGDGHDSVDTAIHSTIKRFDANTGKFLGVFVEPRIEPIANRSSSFLDGPRGLIFNCEGRLLVANGNQNQDYAGEVFEYKNMGRTGLFLRALVSHDVPGNPADHPNPNAPFAPRGVVLSQRYLIVASQQGDNPTNGNGKIGAYDPQTGVLQQVLPVPVEFANGNFHPDGIVIYKGLLYVANRRFGSGGEILRYDAHSLTFRDVFIRSNGENLLSAPEGVVFGPDGNLYVISYSGLGGVDGVLIFAGPDKANRGSFLDKINFADPNHPEFRAAGSALLFGPGGRLYVPITGPGSVNGLPPGVSTGEVRVYDVRTRTYPNPRPYPYQVLVASFLKGGPMEEPWYLTFGKTDPATLGYREDNGDRELHEE